MNTADPQSTAPAPILVVDDEDELRDEMVYALDLLGIPAVAAADGLEALAVLEKSPDIRVVLTDLRMPNMDGLALATALADRPAGAEIEVIMLSGHLTQADNDEASRLGIFACLNKPTPLRRIAETVRQALDLAARRRQQQLPQAAD